MTPAEWRTRSYREWCLIALCWPELWSAVMARAWECIKTGDPHPFAPVDWDVWGREVGERVAAARTSTGGEPSCWEG